MVRDATAKNTRIAVNWVSGKVRHCDPVKLEAVLREYAEVDTEDMSPSEARLAARVEVMRLLRIFGVCPEVAYVSRYSVHNLHRLRAASRFADFGEPKRVDGRLVVRHEVPRG